MPHPCKLMQSVEYRLCDNLESVFQVQIDEAFNHWKSCWIANGDQRRLWNRVKAKAGTPALGRKHDAVCLFVAAGRADGARR
jgi:hypothetical protein